MSNQLPFSTDLEAFHPYSKNLQDFVKKELRQPRRYKDQFFDPRKRTRVNTLNGIVRRALIANYNDDPGWIKLPINEPTVSGMLGPRLRLSARDEHNYYRFYIGMPSQHALATVQFVRQLEKHPPQGEIIGGPQFLWTPEGGNDSVRVVNPVSQENLGKIAARNCALQGLALVAYNTQYNKRYVA